MSDQVGDSVKSSTIQTAVHAVDSPARSEQIVLVLVLVLVLSATVLVLVIESRQP
jgi:hypothetical protein